MDKGQSRRRYNQLVGKIQALAWMLDTLKEETQKLGEDLERD